MSAASVPPKYRRQKFKNRQDLAFVVLDGKRVSLGRYGSPQSHEEYARLIAEHAAGTYQSPSDTQGETTVADVLAAYVDHLEREHRPKASKSGTRKQVGPISAVLKQAMKPLRRLYGDMRVKDFGPKKLKTVRYVWIEKGLTRKTINDYVVCVKQVFKWGTAEELVPPGVYEGLKAVDGLRRGKSMAKESEPVRPVPVAHINAVEPFVSRPVWALIQLQLLAGTRPGELLGLRAIDLDTSEDVWVFSPKAHKTAHHNLKRHIIFGPRAQEILQEFMADRPLDRPFFSPDEAENERKAKGYPEMKGRKKSSPRRADQTWQRKTDRVVGDSYDTGTYRQAIKRACKEAGVDDWAPNRLRHTAGTKILKIKDLNSSRVVLGHRDSSTTEVYAERDLELQKQIMREIG